MNTSNNTDVSNFTITMVTFIHDCENRLNEFCKATGHAKIGDKAGSNLAAQSKIIKSKISSMGTKIKVHVMMTLSRCRFLLRFSIKTECRQACNEIIV